MQDRAIHRDASAGQGHASKYKCRNMQYGSDALILDTIKIQVSGRAMHRDASAGQGHASKCKCRNMQHGSGAFILDARAKCSDPHVSHDFYKVADERI